MENAERDGKDYSCENAKDQKTTTPAEWTAAVRERVERRCRLHISDELQHSITTDSFLVLDEEQLNGCSMGTRDLRSIQLHPYLPDDFLSIGIDTKEIVKRETIDFTSERLRQLAAELAPARLRLGNEPNSFNHTFNITITPEELGNDFRKLKSLLTQYGNDKALIVGPDTTRPQSKRPYCLDYMVEFLGNASDAINARSWHQYYLNSRTATLDDFWNVETFNLLEDQIVTMQQHTSKYNNVPMWLSETGSSYGGGASGLSDSYAATPLWLDKLGLAAKYNITIVIRQSFIGGHYSLIDKNLNPLPDWWLILSHGRRHIGLGCSAERLLLYPYSSAGYNAICDKWALN
ncbi:Heparanase [Eumeta japonica]|uniref:Heparanase n=1 Tax=Eumeta variegata TaxID=151549 RepID=A0A4C2ADY9_EUMVA|nr:Heparanase [Eumeta japonica]